jgi:hypothetical protein
LTRALLETPAARGQTEPYPSEVVAIRGLTGIAAARPVAVTMLALAVVEMQQAEAVQGRAEARVVPGELVLRLAGAAATPGRIVARPVVPGRVEPRPAEAAMVLVVVIVVQEKAAPVAVAAAQAPVEAYQVGAAMAPVAEAVQGTAGARVVGAAARPGRTAVPAAARERAEKGLVEAAMDPVVVAAAPGSAGARVDLGAVEPIPAVPEVQATAGMDLAAARLGMTRVELVVATPAAVATQIGPYLVEGAAGAPCARQRPEAQMYLVEKALEVPYVRRS